MRMQKSVAFLLLFFLNSSSGFVCLFFLIFVDLIIWLLRVLVAACELLVAACELFVVACMWDLVPWPGIKPGPPAIGALNHWTTREVPSCISIHNEQCQQKIRERSYFLKHQWDTIQRKKMSQVGERRVNWKPLKVLREIHGDTNK